MTPLLSLVLTLTLTDAAPPDGTLVVHFAGTVPYHVGIVLDGYVVHASPPDVHRLPVARYRRVYGAIWPSTGGIRFIPPADPFSPGAVKSMRRYASELLGYPYGAGLRGVHCSETVALILTASGRYDFRGRYQWVGPPHLYRLYRRGA